MSIKFNFNLILIFAATDFHTFQCKAAAVCVSYIQLTLIQSVVQQGDFDLHGLGSTWSSRSFGLLLCSLLLLLSLTASFSLTTLLLLLLLLLLVLLLLQGSVLCFLLVVFFVLSTLPLLLLNFFLLYLDKLTKTL